jgi:hypothetical protein
VNSVCLDVGVGADVDDVFHDFVLHFCLIGVVFCVISVVLSAPTVVDDGENCIVDFRLGLERFEVGHFPFRWGNTEAIS